MLTRHHLNRLTHALVAALTLCTLTQAAPAPTDMPTATYEGLPATLEISKLDGDFTNTLPNYYSIRDPQSYASTDVETEAVLAPTSLPMTIEEMALAEMAAIVAELTKTTADEMKAKTTIEEEDKLIRRRAEEAKRQAIEHEIANVVDTIEDGDSFVKDYVTATTFRANFLDVIATTVKPLTIAVASITTAPSNTTKLTDNSSSVFLNELVRATAAANEILATALNVATMSPVNVTASNTTQSFVTSEATILKPVEPVNSEHVDLTDGLTLKLMSDSDALPEQTIHAWQASTPTTNETENSSAMIDVRPITSSHTIDKDTTEKLNNIQENSEVSFSVKPLESESSSEKSTRPELLELTISETPSDTQNSNQRLKTQNADGADVSVDTEKPLIYLENPQNSETVQRDDETAASMQLIRAEKTKEAILVNDDNEEEFPKINLYDENSTGSSKATTFSSTPNPKSNEADNEVTETSKFSNSKSITPEIILKTKEGNDKEANPGLNVNQGLNYENNETGQIVNETQKNVVVTEEREIFPITTIEPLETLITVENEPNAPNKIVGIEQKKEVPAKFKPDEDGATTVLPTTNPELEITARGNEKLNSNNAADSVERNIENDQQQTTTTKSLIGTEMPSTKTLTESTNDVDEESELEAIEMQADSSMETTTITTADRTLFSLGLEVKSVETNTPSAQEFVESVTTTNLAPITEMLEAASSKIFNSHAGAQFSTFDFTSSPINVELASLTTTTTNPVTDEFLQATTTAIIKKGIESIAESEGAIPTTLTSSRNTTTNTPANNELVEAAAQAHESESNFLNVPATTSGEIATTTDEVEAETELNTITTTTARTVNTIDREQPLYMRPMNEPQQQERAASKLGYPVDVDREIATTTKAEILEATDRETGREDDIKERSFELATNAAANVTNTEDTTLKDGTDATTESMSTIPTITTAELATTPPTAVTTITPEPQTATTTTTLSPMSLIIAEHEARTQDKTPPRVSRTISDDGIEVLSGYSIVYHMHAAAMAALAAREA